MQPHGLGASVRVVEAWSTSSMRVYVGLGERLEADAKLEKRRLPAIRHADRAGRSREKPASRVAAPLTFECFRRQLRLWLPSLFFISPGQPSLVEVSWLSSAPLCGLQRANIPLPPAQELTMICSAALLSSAGALAYNVAPGAAAMQAASASERIWVSGGCCAWFWTGYRLLQSRLAPENQPGCCAHPL